MDSTSLIRYGYYYAALLRICQGLYVCFYGYILSENVPQTLVLSGLVAHQEKENAFLQAG